jgi:hypothetical protein
MNRAFVSAVVIGVTAVAAASLAAGGKGTVSGEYVEARTAGCSPAAAS